MKNLVLYASVLLLTLTSCKTKYPDLEPGLYAEFVTNKGTFVAKFYHQATPLTVANFVELSRGTHPRVDFLWPQTQGKANAGAASGGAGTKDKMHRNEETLGCGIE